MKKVIITAALITGFSAIGFAQGRSLPAPTVVNTVQDQTPNVEDRTHLLKFNEEVHNFGDIKKGDNAETEFVFKNNSNETVNIISAKASCGCTVPTYSTEPIAPGKTGSIKVKYNTNTIGKIDKSVTVTTNLGVKKLKITGNVENVPTTSAPTTSSNVRNK